MNNSEKFYDQVKDWLEEGRLKYEKIKELELKLQDKEA